MRPVGMIALRGEDGEVLAKVRDGVEFVQAVDPLTGRMLGLWPRVEVEASEEETERTVILHPVEVEGEEAVPEVTEGEEGQGQGPRGQQRPSRGQVRVQAEVDIELVPEVADEELLERVRVELEGQRGRSFWLSPVGGLVGFGLSFLGAGFVNMLFTPAFGHQIGAAVGAGLWVIGYGVYLCIYTQQQPWLPKYGVITVHKPGRRGETVLVTEERPIIGRPTIAGQPGPLSCLCWRLMQERWKPLSELGVNLHTEEVLSSEAAGEE